MTTRHISIETTPEPSEQKAPEVVRIPQTTRNPKTGQPETGQDEGTQPEESEA